MKSFSKTLLPVALLLITTASFGQRYRIEGTICDQTTRHPIGSAGIILKNSSRGTSSNDQGAFSFEVKDFPAVLFIQSLGYLRDTVVIAGESEFITGYKNQNHLFYLKQSPIQIREVQIKARTTLFEKDPYAIIDYRIVGKRIVALGYRNGNEFRKEVLLSDLSGKMISKHSYPNLDSLYQDCQGDVFAFCSDSAFELRLSRKEVTIKNAYRSSFIRDFIEPVCGLSDSLVFLKKSSANHQYDNYFAVRDTQDAMVVYSTGGMIKETQAAASKDASTQLGQVPISMEPPKGGGNGASMQNFLKQFEQAYGSYFESQFRLLVDFPPVFSRMIPHGKYQLIFSREAATIFWIDGRGAIVREVGMINRLNGILYRDVHLDPGTGKIYVEYPQGPFTHFMEIDPETGLEVHRFMVNEFRHIEKCEFLNDRLYFLYQPDTGLRIKKICSIWI